MSKKVPADDRASKTAEFKRVLYSGTLPVRPTAEMIEAAVFVRRRTLGLGHQHERIEGLDMHDVEGIRGLEDPPIATAALNGDPVAQNLVMAAHSVALARKLKSNREEKDVADTRLAWGAWLVRRLGDAEKAEARRKRFMFALDRYAIAQGERSSATRERSDDEIHLFIELLNDVLEFFEPAASQDESVSFVNDCLNPLVVAWRDTKPGVRKTGAGGKYVQLERVFAGTDMHAAAKTWENEHREMKKAVPSISPKPG